MPCILILYNSSSEAPFKPPVNELVSPIVPSRVAAVSKVDNNTIISTSTSGSSAPTNDENSALGSNTTTNTTTTSNTTNEINDSSAEKVPALPPVVGTDSDNK